MNFPLLAQLDSSKTVVLEICCNKTTSIVFPQMIKAIDRGSKDLLVQKVNGVEQVLQVKAGKENFTETNLTVITADGRLWPFVVRYTAAPCQMEIQLDSAANIFETISRQKRSVHGVRDDSYEIIFRLKGLFIQRDVLYYQLELENQSNISYDIDLLRFYIKDKRQSKRTASQELEQEPLSIYGNAGSVVAQSKQLMVAALPKFTIPDKKNFFIELTERNGGRHLRLKIRNKKIVKAKMLL